MAKNFGNLSRVHHILDCPESNIPALSKSKASFNLDKLKEVCPLMFPVTFGSNDNTDEESKTESSDAAQLKNTTLLGQFRKDKERADIQFAKIKDTISENMGSSDSIDLHQSQGGMEYALYPLKFQGVKVDRHESIIKSFGEEFKEKDEFMARLTSEVKDLQALSPDFERALKYCVDRYAELDTLDLGRPEPSIFFLGTVSMKPVQYRGASAIYYMQNGHGILMDTAEGSYG
mmetsp:Transcript_23024/g.35605  ORF Transcript_23024/g.35605 Transcript_23024/m.35605 type:complete len:232 (+) Transcript_23024:1114-1809(+)